MDPDRVYTHPPPRRGDYYPGDPGGRDPSPPPPQQPWRAVGSRTPAPLTAAATPPTPPPRSIPADPVLIELRRMCADHAARGDRAGYRTFVESSCVGTVYGPKDVYAGLDVQAAIHRHLSIQQ